MFVALAIPYYAYSQRKDSDAKISPFNFKRAAQGERVKVSDANIRIRYAFNAENINDKSTWIDEGQLKIAPDMTDYSSFLSKLMRIVWLTGSPPIRGLTFIRLHVGFRVIVPIIG